jgi:hypothetical protein
MTEEERRIISAFVERIAGAGPAARPASPWGGSVPATQSRPPLPPVDQEADALLAELFARYPEARYRLTQTAFVQEHALTQAQNRIQELEWELENTRRQAQAAPQRSGGLFGGMFGGGQPQRQPPMAPPPQPLPPPGGYNPGMFQQQSRGSGFLGTALTTAAGVAGGMVLGNMLMNAFSGSGVAHAAQGVADSATGIADSATGAVGDFAQQEVPAAASPWTDPGSAGGQDAAPVSDTGGWGQDAWSAPQDQGYAQDDAAGFDDGGGFEEDV